METAKDLCIRIYIYTDLGPAAPRVEGFQALKACDMRLLTGRIQA